MSEPREFLIVKALQAALQAISVADGYFYTVARAAVKLDPDANVENLLRPSVMQPNPFIVLELTPDEWEYYQDGEAKIEFPFVVHWAGDTDATDDDARVQTFIRACADIERALTRDVTLGGLVYDTRITNRSIDTSLSGARVWAMVAAKVSFTRQFGES